MKISVVIPCFNAAETIACQLEALAKQVWVGNWEVVISDNGARDETLEIVEEFKEKLPNLQVVDASNRKGAGYARNLGVSKARGDTILFCDADDEVAPGWLEAMARALSQSTIL